MVMSVLHSTLNISETVRDRGLVPIQRTTDRNVPSWNEMVT